MAFRIKETTGCLALALLFAAMGAAEPVTIEVRHRHLRKGATGTLTFTDDGVRFDEPGKRAAHSRAWKYPEVQQFELAPHSIHLRTYEDVRWQGGRDLEYVFDRLPDGAADRLYPVLAAKLDQRFIADLPSPAAGVLWEAPAKMLHRTGGSNGTLRIAADRIVFESPHASRTWRIADVANLSSAGPFELSITSLDGETRFQLKQALPEDRYNELWRHFNPAPGLKALMPLGEMHHE